MNTRLRFLVVLSVAVLASGCGKDDRANLPSIIGTATAGNPASQPAPGASNPAPKPASGVSSETWSVPPMVSFDINDIPMTNKKLGEFPFFTPPKGYRYVTPSLTVLDEGISLKESHYHLYAFSVGRFYKIDGKVLKVALHNDRIKEPSEKDLFHVRRHYKDAISAAGGVMVYGMDAKPNEALGPSPKKESRVEPESLKNLRQVYVIHAKDSEIWFDVDCSSKYNCLFIVTQKGKQ
jgi:hypothetical protein